MKKFPAIVMYLIVMSVPRESLVSQVLSWETLPGTSGKIFDVLQVYSPGRIFVGGLDSLYVSTDDGMTWQGCLSCMNKMGMARTSLGAIALAVDGGAFLSSDTGRTWYLPSRPWNYYSTSICIDPDGNMYLGEMDYTGIGVLRSTDGGLTWNPANSGLMNSHVTAILATSSHDIYAGTYGGGLFLSADYGGTWKLKGLVNHNQNALAVDRNQYLYVGAGDGGYSSPDTGVYRSTNLGITWARTPLPMNTVFSLCTWSPPPEQAVTVRGLYRLAASPELIFAGGCDRNGPERGGVYHSSDAGLTWTHDTTGFTATTVHSVAFDSTGRVLVTTDNGILRTLRPLITSLAAEKNIVPGEFRLLQNYPNPFNPHTTIRYILPGRTHVTLSIFNILGQVIQTLVNDEQDAGEQSVVFEGSNCPSGVYYCRVQAGNYVKVNKLLLLK